MSYLITENGRRNLQEINPAKQGRDAAKEEDKYLEIAEELVALGRQLDSYVRQRDLTPSNVESHLKKNKGAYIGIGKDIQKWAKKI